MELSALDPSCRSSTNSTRGWQRNSMGRNWFRLLSRSTGMSLKRHWLSSCALLKALYAVSKHVNFGPYRTTFELAETEVDDQHWSRTVNESQAPQSAHTSSPSGYRCRVSS